MGKYNNVWEDIWEEEEEEGLCEGEREREWGVEFKWKRRQLKHSSGLPFFIRFLPFFSSLLLFLLKSLLLFSNAHENI